MSMVGSRIRAFRRVALASTVLVALASAATATAGERTYSFNFSQISLSEALRAYAKITGQQIIFTEDLVSGRTAAVLKGAYTAEDALAQLLANTGLVVERSPSGAIMVRRVAAQAAPTTTTAQGPTPDAPEGAPKDDEKKAEDDRKVERVVVTGTNIRGKRPKSSPLDVYTKDDIERSGATTTEQFMQKVPQNLGTRSQFSSVRTPEANYENVNGVDLRGLGVGTTLTLLNGRRLGLAANGQAVDISSIPFGAIERVEILTDGASAIYGSDAIGGVVNFILRDDFDGAQTAMSYSGVTSGGLRQVNLSQTYGQPWDTGHALVSLDLFSASSLKTTDRSFSAPSGPGTLTPIDQRQSILLSLSQDVGERFNVEGDFFFSRRDVKNNLTDATGSFLVQQNAAADTEQSLANVGANYQFGDSLNLSVLATYANIDVNSETTSRIPALNNVTVTPKDTVYSVLDVTAMLDGVLLTLPGGPVRFSAGGGSMEEHYNSATVKNSSTPSNAELGRTTTYLFGEILAPLVGEDQNIPFIHRFELSLAARYTRIDDTSEPSLAVEFGDNVSPKVGLLWSPLPELSLRATYAESFRAPTLTELDPAGALGSLRAAFPIGGVLSPVLIVAGPSTELGPETAESYTVGFDYRAPSNPTLRLSGTYFNINYIDRISNAASAQILARANPSAWPDLVYHPSSIAEVQALLNATNVTFNNTGIDLTAPNAAALVFALPNIWINDVRFRNLSLTTVDGFDLNASYPIALPFGELSLGAYITWMLDYREQATSTAPIVTVVDTVLRPVDLRGRLYATISQGGFDSTLSVNYVDDYRNPIPGAPQSIDSWTTVDWHTAYAFGDEDGDILRGLRVSLSVQNLFDEDPPFVGRNVSVLLVNPGGFDAANASPIGRFVSIGVTKAW